MSLSERAAGVPAEAKRVSTVKDGLLRLLLLALSLLVILASDHAGLFEGVNRALYDVSFRVRGPLPPSEQIVIVSIDEQTLSRLGRWPLPRRHYASLLDRLHEADVVAFDLLMSESSEEDPLFAAAMRKQGRVVLPAYIDRSGRASVPLGVFPARRTGHVHVEPGVDGVVREVHHTLSIVGLTVQSLASAIVEEITGKPFPRESTAPGREQGIAQQDLMRINFAGGTGVFASLSLADVIDGRYPEGFFRHRAVLVGVTADGIDDALFTPFSEDRRGIPGVELQAHILNTLLTDSAIHLLPSSLLMAFTAVFALLAFLVFLRVEERRALAIGLAMIVLFTAAGYGLFVKAHLWVRPAVVYVSLLAMFLIAYGHKLREAIRGLDMAYAAVVPLLRWAQDRHHEGGDRGGVAGLLTPRGVHAKTGLLKKVTDQLAFEKELTDRALFSDIIGVLLFDLDRGTVMANDQVTLLCKANSLGVDGVDEFVNGLALFVAERTDLKEGITRLKSLKGKMTFTVSFPLPDKTYLKVDASSLFVGGRTYLLFIFSDITQTKELDNLKGHIVSTVSHELKTPLTSIQGLSEILARKLEGTMQEYARIINEESVRLTRFVDTFLDITRMEAGRHPIMKTPVHLGELIREVVPLLLPVAQKKAIAISTDLPGDMDPVMLDRDLTKQCLVNLLENAIKYSPSPSEVTIGARDIGGVVKVDVTDLGRGIAGEELGRIFEKFYRSPSEETAGIKGSGLGLTFVKEAVEGQGGQVTVTSSPGKGSTFSMVFLRRE